MAGFKSPIFAANYFRNWKGVIKPDAFSETHALETKSALNTKEIVLHIAGCKVYPQLFAYQHIYCVSELLKFCRYCGSEM